MFEQNIIEKYDDYKVVGNWGTYNVETKESISGGEMLHRTIKVKDEDGSIKLDYEWITDEDAKTEKNGVKTWKSIYANSAKLKPKQEDIILFQSPKVETWWSILVKRVNLLFTKRGRTTN